MLNTLRQIIEGTVDRLYYYVTNFAPPLLAALFVIVLSWAAALAVRWLIYRIFKGTAIDKFLRQSGVAFMLDRSGRLRATRIGAETAYWALLLGGVMLGLSIFDTNLTSQVINKVVFLLPKLVTAGLILLAGAWLSLYLSRSLLVWAVNEDLPSPRRLAAMLRVVIMFVAVVVAADQLDFAKAVFLAAFIILVGGAVLTASLAIGIGASSSARIFIERKRQQSSGTHERSLWSHL